MRRAAAAAALAALAALAAPACKPSSLTPGWIGERAPEDPDTTLVVNGVWLAVTTGGGVMRFQVASGAVADFTLVDEGPCRRFFTLSEQILVENGGFVTTVELDSGGFFTVGANFSSRDVAQGSYGYSGVSIIGDCPREGGGTFVATPVF